ncbi:hypothetical protein [Hymenobacter sp. GOD-10R]|uniref:hypothetical protein n=1 Tax=Hymenobacter sp. GOD-10R TaxID=3093922 RepID=UPI002D784B34|nr:hypothetical protein [Hymenobacter sp. GOD-10R]WRQ26658.1 hypothetical protein SD425_16420 [Hymenobacter sp. GOD-10R]
MIWLLLLPLAVCLEALAQARLNLVTREWVPPFEQKRVSLALHYLYPLLYGLLAISVVRSWWPGYVLAVLVRLAMFDVILNLGKKLPPFTVGTSALTDDLLRHVWPEHPERLSMVVRIGALGLSIGFVYYFRQ